MEFPGGWIEHQTYVNAKYDKELAELEASTITPEDKAVVNIVEHQEKVEEVKEENTDGLVRNIPEEDKLTLQKELINYTIIATAPGGAFFILKLHNWTSRKNSL